MKSLTGSLLGTAVVFALLLPAHAARSQESCSEGSSEERIQCLVQVVTDLRLEMQRGVADLTTESQRVATKFDMELRDAKRVIQESIAGQTRRVDGMEIQLGAGLEEVKGDIRTAVDGLRSGGEVEALRRDVEALKNTAATSQGVQATLRDDIESGVTSLTTDIEGILKEIQQREAAFAASVQELDSRLDELSSSSGPRGVRFGSGGNDDFGESDTLTLDVTSDSIVFVTADARVPVRPTEEFAIRPLSARHQKCEAMTIGPRVGRSVRISCTFGGLQNGTVTIAGADPRGENSYRYFVLTPN